MREGQGRFREPKQSQSLSAVMDLNKMANNVFVRRPLFPSFENHCPPWFTICSVSVKMANVWLEKCWNTCKLFSWEYYVIFGTLKTKITGSSRQLTYNKLFMLLPSILIALSKSLAEVLREQTKIVLRVTEFKYFLLFWQVRLYLYWKQMHLPCLIPICHWLSMASDRLELTRLHILVLVNMA